MVEHQEYVLDERSPQNQAAVIIIVVHHHVMYGGGYNFSLTRDP